MHKQLVTMLELQDSMNSKVHLDWRSQGFAWYRAIWIECAELMEHHGWKWWKKHQPDRNQVVLELIDIWHFGLSSLLEQEEDLDKIAGQVASRIAIMSPAGDFLADVEDFAEQVLRQKKFEVSAFAKLMVDVDLDFAELYKTYVGKNVLNIFRQDKGYKLGTYLKVWQGREDNEHLVEVVNSVNIASATFQDEVYQGLLSRYPSN